MKKLNLTLVALVMLLTGMAASAQTFVYKPIKGFSDATNDQLEAFFNSTVPMNTRKVAVFDCDGTLFGQAPYYLADEALYDFARENYEGKTDSLSVAKMAVIDQLLHGDNVGLDYVQNRIKFLSGLTADEVKQLGKEMYHKKYQNKMYPEMKALIQNLKDYDFEVWIVSASPELLYQQFCVEQLGIPEDRVLGVKGLVNGENVLTDQLVFPVPQDGGKAEVVNTLIKARPLFAGGNARGDMELMNTSVGMKLIVNPDDVKAEKDMGGKTVKQYWSQDPNCIIEYCNDVPTGNYEYTTQKWGVKNNRTNAKANNPVSY